MGKVFSCEQMDDVHNCFDENFSIYKGGLVSDPASHRVPQKQWGG
jgi:hypothetical protein